jgi:hypothetical protein
VGWKGGGGEGEEETFRVKEMQVFNVFVTHTFVKYFFLGGCHEICGLLTLLYVMCTGDALHQYVPSAHLSASCTCLAWCPAFLGKKQLSK